MNKYRRYSIFVILALASTGCAGWMRGEAGFTTSTTFDSGRQGASGGVEAALGGETDPLLLDMGLRGKVTEKAGDIEIFVGGLHLRQPDPVSFYALGGAYVLQGGIVNGNGSFGMFSPVLEMGAVFKLGRNDIGDTRMLTLGTRIEYDLRFTSQPNEGFWTFNLGYAVGKGI